MPEDVSERVARALGGEVDLDIVPTRFPSLDRAVGGGLRRGDLVLLAGDHGAGTSSLALAIAMRAPSRALFLTGEMRPERVVERALAMTARVSLESLRLGLLSADESARLQAATANVRARSPDVETLYRGGIEPVAGALDSAPTAPLVVVDSIDSVIPAGAAPREDRVADAMLALKRFALERNVVVLLLCHLPLLDRSRQDRRPRLDDLGAGGMMALHADLVLGLHREELYDADQGVRGAAELLLLKHRDGALGYVDLYFSAGWLRFEDVLDPDA